MEPNVIPMLFWNFHACFLFSVLVHSFYHKFSSDFVLNHEGFNISFENQKVISLHDVIYGWNEVNESTIPSSLDSKLVTVTHKCFPTSYASYVDSYGALAMYFWMDRYYRGSTKFEGHIQQK